MPKLGEYKWILDLVFFLYDSKEDAERGENCGGTGFLVSVPSARWPETHRHIHGVTNWHVACGGKAPTSPVIRINRHAGVPEIFDLDSSEWICKPSSYDVAVSPPLDLNPQVHKAEAVDLSWFLTEEDEINDEINAADDTFMVGRFIDHDGVEANLPSFRFGHVSIMNAKIQQLTRYVGRSIVVDMHSRTGYSGSPVFIYRTPGSIFSKGGTVMGGGHYIKLLGIHWGQFPEKWRIGQKSTPRNALVEDQYVEGLSGMTCVIPAAHIAEVIAMPKLQNMREEAELAIEREHGRYDSSPRTERFSAEQEMSSADENPQHREDFNRLLNTAVRKPKQDD